MNYSFDYFNRIEKPSLVLCTPAKTPMYSLDIAYNLTPTFRFNSLDEIEFHVPEKINGNDVEVYDHVKMKKLVHMVGFGYFEISEAPFDVDGDVDVKIVKARSIEYKMVGKRFTLSEGTYQFYDPINQDGTLMKTIINLLPGWTLGSIDATLYDRYRTFEVSDTNIYNFLMEEVQETYECLFVFDTENMTISAYDIDSYVEETDIFLSFDNLLKQGELKELDDQITTCLYVYGEGDLDIRTVNPLGTTAIYNFDYYKTTEWMSQSLIDAIDAWEVQIETYRIPYTDTLTALKDRYEIITGLYVELTELQNEYLALEGIQKVRIEQGLDITDITNQMDAKQAEIDSKELDIWSQEEGVLPQIIAYLEFYNEQVSFETNFTTEQFEELSQYIFENTYKNDNIVQTDIMTNEEIVAQAEILYTQAQDVLARLSTPRFTFEVESVNFAFLKEFETFTEQLELGATVKVSFPNGQTTDAVLLELSFNYDTFSNFKLVLSNRFRSSDSAFTFADLFGEAISAGQEVKFDSGKWSNWNNNYKDSVSTFITSALDASVNQVINAENQEILIGENGLRGRKLNTTTGTYEDEQVWLTSSILVFTDDNWQTASTALGKIDVDGVEQYGLIADVVVGRLLAGNELTITNEGGNFVLDSNGAVLTDVEFSVESPSARTIINPTDGIKIQGNVGGTWTDKFYADASGNVVFTGDLSGATGTFSGEISATAGSIGGWDILVDGLYDNVNGNYIKSNGNIKLGALDIQGSTAVFAGDIYANNLIGNVVDGQISNLGAGKIDYGGSYGTLSGSGIYGGALGGSAGAIYLDKVSGAMLIDVSAFSVEADNAVALSGSNYLIQGSYGTINSGLGSGSLSLYAGDLRINGASGITQNVYIGSAYSAKRIDFTKGILTGFTWL